MNLSRRLFLHVALAGAFAFSAAAPAQTNPSKVIKFIKDARITAE